MTALAKRADERFQSARAMQTALHAALAQSGPTEQLAEPTVAGDRASYSRTQSLDEHAPPDAHAVGAPPFGRVPSNAPSLGARPLGGEPAAAATLALDSASEESLDGATQPIERAHQAAVEPRPPVAPVTSTAPSSGVRPLASSALRARAAVRPAVPMIMQSRALSCSGMGSSHSPRT